MLALEDIFKRRLFNEMLHKVLPKNVKTQGGSANEYALMVLDAATQRLLAAGRCDIDALVREGICLVEDIKDEREALPALDAVYFLKPTSDNVEKLVADVSGGKPKYRRFHVFFTQKLNDELFSRIAGQPGLVRCMRSFGELNMSFIAHDHRTFHFEDHRSLPSVFGFSPLRPESITEIACSLATLCASFNSTWKIRYALKDSGSFNAGPVYQEVCKRIATELGARLDEIAQKKAEAVEAAEGIAEVPGGDKPEGSVVLIVDRSIDWTSSLLHDMHYEALIYDLIKSASREQSTSSNSKELLNVGGPKDPFWDEYRHLPIWVVNDLVCAETKKWTAQDDERRAQAKAGSNNVAAEVVQALQTLPEFKERYDKISAHADACQQCFQTLQSQGLVDLTELEQDLATGVDSSGKALANKRIEKQLKDQLANPKIGEGSKLRLLLLYLCSELGAGCSDKAKEELALLLKPKTRRVVTHPAWVHSSKAACEKPAVDIRKHYFSSLARASSSPQTARWSRWQPSIQQLVEDVTQGTLNSVRYPEVVRSCNGCGGDVVDDLLAQLPDRVVVFILGGVTLPEARVVNTAFHGLSTEVFVGGSCVMTASYMIEVLGA